MRGRFLPTFLTKGEWLWKKKGLDILIEALRKGMNE